MVTLGFKREAGVHSPSFLFLALESMLRYIVCRSRGGRDEVTCLVCGGAG